MKEYNIILTKKAKDDIVDIGDYIAYTLLEPETAHRFVTGLRSAIATLKEFPDRFIGVVLSAMCRPLILSKIK